MPALMETWTSPKFITCPDCGERYDHAKRRRLIDTCGHPRCYACLFVDNPCPLCLKLPQSPRSRSTSYNKDGFRGSHDSLMREAAFDVASSDSEAKGFKGSHPNLSELHKIRSATLPHSGFRTDNYFRSLYKYDPSSQESLTDQICEGQKDIKRDRPKSAHLPNYHTSLDNLHDKFWKSVQRTSRPGSPTSPGNNLPPSPLSKSNNSTSPDSTNHVFIDEDHVRLVVPGSRARSRTTDAHMEGEIVRQGVAQAPQRGMGARPHSASDLFAKLTAEAMAQNELAAKRSYHGNKESQHQRALSCSPPQLNYKNSTERRQPSDRSSDASSVRASDSWSESSGEDEAIFAQEHSLNHENTNFPKMWCEEGEHQSEGYGLPSENETNRVIGAQSNSKKPIYNSFANTTYWVMEPSQNATTEYPRRGHHKLRFHHGPMSNGSMSNGPQVCTNGDVRTKVSTL